MSRCPHCDYPTPDDRARVGARCPSCRDPLYEPVGRVARRAREDETSCPVHVGIESVGVCFRCGNYLCETCRTRWRGQLLCAACVDKALAAQEATPEHLREPLRQSVTALTMGAGVWVTAGISLLVLRWFDASSGKGGIIATFAVFVILAACVLLAAIGTGQALAALRERQGPRTLALTGLVVTGLYIGAAMGLGVLGLWQH